MTLKDFMNETFYREYLQVIEKNILEMIDMESEVHEIILNFENESLEKSGVSINDLKWLIENHCDKTSQYIAKKNAIYVEPDGGEEGIINDPPMVFFPIGHLIEYYLILKKPERLVDYLRSIHIPNAKKYAKEIKEIYDEIR